MAMMVGNRDGPPDGGPGRGPGPVDPGPYGACDMFAIVAMAFAGALFTNCGKTVVGGPVHAVQQHP
jgi:hypothetical protein